jgi:hypothetical protein
VACARLDVTPALGPQIFSFVKHVKFERRLGTGDPYRAVNVAGASFNWAISLEAVDNSRKIQPESVALPGPRSTGVVRGVPEYSQKERHA